MKANQDINNVSLCSSEFLYNIFTMFSDIRSAPPNNERGQRGDQIKSES